MDSIALLKNELNVDPNVAFALVFGSQANGKAHKKSDLDLAVYYHRPPTGLEILDAVNHLSETAGKEVDLMILNRASAFSRHQVMKNCLRVVLRDPQAYSRFREQTMTDYAEYKYISGMPDYD